MCARVEGILAQTSMDPVLIVGDVLAVVSIQPPSKVLGRSQNLQKTNRNKINIFIEIQFPLKVYNSLVFFYVQKVVKPSHSISEHFLHPKKKSQALYLLVLPAPQPEDIINFSFSLDFPILGFSYNRISKYVVFCDAFLHLA